MSNNHQKFYIDGKWTDPSMKSPLGVINPATEQEFTTILLGSADDIDKAVAAARGAFRTFSNYSKADRLALLKEILAQYNLRYEDLAVAVSHEMGAPLDFARSAQAASGRKHLESTIRALEEYEFQEKRGSTLVVREPIGVCALITPWNWPLNQIVCKVAPAIAAGCTMVLKPSEIAPISAVIFSEIMHAAGVPAGVFNMIQGTGPDVGQVLSSHPEVDMVSFTGSTRAGIMVAKSAADTVKRVTQELGGKSANIVLDDADLEAAVTKGVEGCFSNTGQSCDAPTRLLVPRNSHDEAIGYAKKAALRLRTGNPEESQTDLGPVISRIQHEKIQGLIASGIDEGATLVCGGVGLPEGLERGYYVKPTVFGDVDPKMTIAREEIFGPVLAIIPYDDDDHAVEIANDTVYGLAAYVQSGSLKRARQMASRLRAGTVSINYPGWDTMASFGGYKQSGNGREYADFGIHEFVEIKSVIGYDP